jgi:hypothetical protein
VDRGEDIPIPKERDEEKRLLTERFESVRGECVILKI